MVISGLLGQKSNMIPKYSQGYRKCSDPKSEQLSRDVKMENLAEDARDILKESNSFNNEDEDLILE